MCMKFQKNVKYMIFAQIQTPSLIALIIIVRCIYYALIICRHANYLHVMLSRTHYLHILQINFLKLIQGVYVEANLQSNIPFLLETKYLIGIMQCFSKEALEDLVIGTVSKMRVIRLCFFPILVTVIWETFASKHSSGSIHTNNSEFS